MVKEVIVAGMPRCGTTYLFRSICGIEPGVQIPKGDKYFNLQAIKTHNLPPPHTSENSLHLNYFMDHILKRRKVIFVFGDPYYAIESIILNRFDEAYAMSCGCRGPVDNIDLTKWDYLNCELMVDTWLLPKTLHRFPLLGLRYETMHDNRLKIEEFLQRKIKWNPWLPRAANFSPSPDIVKTYGRLAKKIEALPDIIFYNL